MPDLRELKQLIIDGKATLEKVPESGEGVSIIPAHLKVTREQYDSNTGEQLADESMTISKVYLVEKKTKLEDELNVVNQALNKLK